MCTLGAHCRKSSEMCASGAPLISNTASTFVRRVKPKEVLFSSHFAKMDNIITTKTQSIVSQFNMLCTSLVQYIVTENHCPYEKGSHYRALLRSCYWFIDNRWGIYLTFPIPLGRGIYLTDKGHQTTVLFLIAVNMKNPFLPDMSDVSLLMSDVFT